VQADLFTASLARGPQYAILAAFAGGLLVCLTPCVYPMIAITVSVFGARQSRSRLHAMGLSTAFVLGISAMFTPLGVVAGTTGRLFGSTLSNPFVLAFVAVVFLALAASMFGAFEFVLPSSLNNRLATPAAPVTAALSSSGWSAGSSPHLARDRCSPESSC